jgi:hypothetical protein
MGRREALGIAKVELNRRIGPESCADQYPSVNGTPTGSLNREIRFGHLMTMNIGLQLHNRIATINYAKFIFGIPSQYASSDRRAYSWASVDHLNPIARNHRPEAARYLQPADRSPAGAST